MFLGIEISKRNWHFIYYIDYQGVYIQVEKLFCNVIRRERESALIKIRKQCSTWKLDEPVIAGTRSGIISRYSREC